MRAIIIVDKGVQDEEFIYPYYRLQEAGFSLAVATVNSGPCFGKYGIPIKANKMTHEIAAKDYDVVIVPGGWQAPEIMRQDQHTLNFIREMYKQNKPIGAICHGPQVLISAGIVSGKVMTCYQGMKDDLINAGALYQNASIVVDGNIITAPHYRDNPDFMKAVLKAAEEYQLSNLVLA